MNQFKSEKQIQNEKDELIKVLKKNNSEMLKMLQDIYNSQQVEGNAEIWAEIKTLIKKATE